jgi:hypothetical protein
VGNVHRNLIVFQFSFACEDLLYYSAVFGAFEDCVFWRVDHYNFEELIFIFLIVVRL